jgi:hypothetical protein
MLLITKTPSYNAKKALVKGIIVGIGTTLIYLILVVITTPSLPPIAAINAAFRINSMIIFGLAIGVGIQIFIGCCGSWLLILSLLPSVFGSSLSVALIQYSKPLSYVGLAIVFGFAALSAFKLKRELKQMEKNKKSVQNI